ncbi:MAG: IS66 family transposase [Byssovorax sp.]
MPLYRQGEELAKLGFEIPSSSMADRGSTGLPIWCNPSTRSLPQVGARSARRRTDATSLPWVRQGQPQRDPPRRAWAYALTTNDEPVAAYLVCVDRKKTAQRPGEIGPEEMLMRRRGFVCADASNLFDASFAAGNCIEIGCNMHARRYFVKALDAKDMRAAAPIAAFKALYDVEASVHEASPERRTEERQKRSKPVYDELLAWCEAYKPNEPPSSLLGKAIQYVLNHQLALTRFLDDGTLPIDNGIVERLHRIPAITRRNFLFAGSHAGGERAAIAYSIIASCILVDVDPEEYLADILPRLARDGVVLSKVDELLPAAWKKARAKSARETSDVERSVVAEAAPPVV